MPLVRICAGGREQSRSLPRPTHPNPDHIDLNTARLKIESIVGASPRATSFREVCGKTEALVWDPSDADQLWEEVREVF